MWRTFNPQVATSKPVCNVKVAVANTGHTVSDEHCGAWWAIVSMLAEIMLIGVGMLLVVWVVRRLQYL